MTTATKKRESKKAKAAKAFEPDEQKESANGKPAESGARELHELIIGMMAEAYGLEVEESDYELAEKIRVAVIANYAEREPAPGVVSVDALPGGVPDVVRRAAEFLAKAGIGSGEEVQIAPGNMQCGAAIDRIQTPTDSKKPIVLVLSMSNTPRNRHLLADMDIERGIAIAGYRASYQLDLADVALDIDAIPLAADANDANQTSMDLDAAETETGEEENDPLGDGSADDNF